MYACKLLKISSNFLKLASDAVKDEWHPDNFLPKTDEHGIIRYQDEWGRYHRADGPARIHPNGHQEYWVKNKLHRIDGPALVSPNEHQYWRHDKSHRVSGPAVFNLNRDYEDIWSIRGVDLVEPDISIQKQRVAKVLELIKDPVIRDLMDQALAEGNTWLNVPSGENPAKEILQDLLLEKRAIRPNKNTSKGINFTNVRDLVEIYEELKDHKRI